MNKNLIIMGAGGFAREVYAWANHAGRGVMAFFSEIPQGDILGLQVLNNPEALSDFKYSEFIVAVGDPNLKLKLWEMALRAHLSPCLPIIHPSAVAGNNVFLGCGTILCPNSVVTTDVKTGDGLILNLGATIGHDCKIGDWVTVSPGANISGNCEVGDLAYIGTNSCVREKISIGRNSVVGMGSVVVKSVPDNETHIGAPARKMLKSV